MNRVTVLRIKKIANYTVAYVFVVSTVISIITGVCVLVYYVYGLFS